MKAGFAEPTFSQKVKKHKGHDYEDASLTIGAAILACALPALGQSVEPKAGTWKTWIISSARDFRVPPPPDAGATAGELRWLHDVVAEPNPSIAESVRFWSAGAPAYQWIELINKRGLTGAPLSPYVHRIYTYSYTVETQRDYNLSKLKRGKKADFNHIFAALDDRVHAIVTFLALLEMLNRQEIRLIQGEGINNFWLTFMDEHIDENDEIE